MNGFFSGVHSRRAGEWEKRENEFEIEVGAFSFMIEAVTNISNRQEENMG